MFFLNIVFFIQIFFCKLIQWKQNRLFYVSCVFANKLEHGKNNNYKDFLFENVFKFYYQKIVFLSIKLISFYLKLHYVKRPNQSV